MGLAQAQVGERDPESPLSLNVNPELQAIINSVYEFTVAGLESAELGRDLAEFGLTEETVADILSTRLQESFASGAQDLGRDLAFSYATDVIAESFADIMMDSVYAERLPDRLRNPLRAMVEATVREGFGVAETIIVDSGTVGPFALVFPVLDRCQDAVEIYEATRGTVQARSATLMSAALGAELNAQLLTRYPSAESERVASQWLEETRETLRDISTPEEYAVLVSMLEDGFAALTAVQARSCDAECEAAIVRLESYRRDAGLGRLDPTAPTETWLRLLGGYDPTETLAQAILELTSLQGSASARSGQTTEAEARNSSDSGVSEDPSDQRSVSLGGIRILSQLPIETLDTIEVAVSGFSGGRDTARRFWITLVRADARIGSWREWYWLDSSPVTLQFRPLSPGRYEFRVHDHWTPSRGRNTYQELFARNALEVVPRAPRTISIELLTPTVLAPSQPIQARVSGMDPMLRYWVTVVPADAAVGRWRQWTYLSGADPQVVRFDGLGPGNYELRVHDNRSGYELLARAPFRVTVPP